MDAGEYYCHIVFGCIMRNDFAGLQEILSKFPDALEYTDNLSNTPLLYACNCGQSDLVSYLLTLGANHQCINIFGQNALTLATYSGNVNTCNVILDRIDFGEFNSSGLLSPLCVAALVGNTDIAKIFLSLETPHQNLFNCPSESIHGICPMQLAQHNDDTNMMDLLRPKHQLHLFKMQ